MYVPEAFAVDDEATLVEFMAAHDFATLVTAGREGPFASHVPVVLERERRVLQFHVAAANPHAGMADGERALVMFTGPHGYVSPGWYTAGPAVPTWNYAAVHVHGRVRPITERAQLTALLAKLVAAHEPRGSAWKMGALPDDYMSRMIADIAGFEISIDRIEGKFKLSQNRSAADRAAVIAALEGSSRNDDRVLADFMRRHAAPNEE
jgi:transcriptional regulator